MSSSMGVMVLSERLSLKDVLYVSDLIFSLISVSKLLKNINCFSLFTDAICVLHDRFMKPMTRASEECDWVYYFKDVKVARVKKTDGNIDQDFCHLRQGHPAFSALSSSPMYFGVVGKASSRKCDVCFRAISDSLNKA